MIKSVVGHYGDIAAVVVVLFFCVIIIIIELLSRIPYRDIVL